LTRANNIRAGYLASAARGRHHGQIHDAAIEDEPLRRTHAPGSYELLGITAVTPLIDAGTWREGKRLGMTTVLGGPHSR
jgi:hypothetical protein